MGFSVRINGEEVHETEVEAGSITRISVRTDQGEAAAVGSPYGQEYVDIVLTTVTEAEKDTMASHVDATRQRERGEKTEKLEADRVKDARKAEKETEAEEKKAEKKAEKSSPAEMSV